MIQGTWYREHGAGALEDQCLPPLGEWQEEAVLGTDHVIFSLHLCRAVLALSKALRRFETSPTPGRGAAGGGVSPDPTNTLWET